MELSDDAYRFRFADAGQGVELGYVRSDPLKVALATFSDILMSRTDLVDGPVRACRTFSRGARPQIAAAYPPSATPELAQA